MPPSMTNPEVPAIRIRSANDQDCKPDRSFILYWMTAFRRSRSNFALQRARDLAIECNRPLVVLEALRIRYRWASDRFHRFVIEGMQDNASDFEKLGVFYYPYVEPEAGAGRGLVRSLSEQACAVVTDDYPCFFHPKMVATVAKRLPSRLELVDSNCLMPLDHADRTFTVAHSYRRWMQKELPTHLQEEPDANPLKVKTQPVDRTLIRTLKQIQEQWPPAQTDKLLSEGGLSNLPIDHSVHPATLVGGPKSAEQLLNQFVRKRLASYGEDRNIPDKIGSSELSPYLHFGHISAHQVFLKLMKAESWNPSKLQKPNGKVNGFWGVGENAEAFLDQLCTWREIGFNMCRREPNYERLSTLPAWTQQTIREHAEDEREYLYSLEEFEQARTHDKIWNAAQRQLVREGRIHNYLRMLWGKKILHWTESPARALEIMIELNNKYALDGRDPNSYSGIFWVLGRYDRAWGPERPIFGKIRYMTSENTAKKHKLGKYLGRFAEE